MGFGAVLDPLFLSRLNETMNKRIDLLRKLHHGHVQQSNLGVLSLTIFRMDHDNVQIQSRTSMGIGYTYYKCEYYYLEVTVKLYHD